MLPGVNKMKAKMDQANIDEKMLVENEAIILSMTENERENPNVISYLEEENNYSKSVLSTLPHLFWVPDIFVCNGWQSALIPNFYKNEYEGINDFYKKIKTVLVVHDLDEYSKIERSELVDIGIEIHPDIKGNKLNIYDVASYNSDAILIMDRPGEKISTKLLKKAAFKDNENKITIFDQKDSDDIDFYAMTETLNQVISDITSK